MPITITQPADQDSVYGSPFVGPINHTDQIPCDLSNLTAREVDANGVLRPGVPLRSNGALVGAPAASQSYHGVGTGLMTGLTADVDAGDEVWEIRLRTAAANGGTFTVIGSKSGIQADAVVGVAYNGKINFTIADGATDFVVGDTFTVVTASPAVHGVTIEPLKLAEGNSQAQLDAAGTPQIAVATICQVNRAIIEDNLGAPLTDAEVAGFLEPGCMVKLLG